MIDSIYVVDPSFSDFILFLLLFATPFYVVWCLVDSERRRN